MQVSVIVPTFNEAENVVELLRRLDASLAGHDAEVIIIDDGSDDLPAIAQATDFPIKLTVIRRPFATGRLGGAVVEGMSRASGELLVVCDGDLQHPPELIPAMVAAAAGADLVVASRYIDGGHPGGLASGFRKAVSRTSGVVTKAAFPFRLRAVTDPMSGFFAVQRSAVTLGALKPKGFKILLEIIAKSGPMTVTEVPLVFGARLAGESSATLAEGVRFVRQLVALRMVNRAALFMLVGASGIVPNLGLLWVLTTLTHMHFLLATFIAIQVAVVWNFVGAEFLVWRDHKAGRWGARFVKFALVAETDLARIPFVIGLVALFGGHSVLASLITLVAAFMFRFTLADKLIYRKHAVDSDVPSLPITEPLAAPANT